VRRSNVLDGELDRRISKRFFDERSRIVVQQSRVGHLYSKSKIDSPESRVTFIGRSMEEINEALKMVNEEIETSRAHLQATQNEISNICNVVMPEMLEFVRELRSARMTAIQEISQTMNACRDVRKFFLESDYEEEMARLERFVRLCKDLSELKKSGVFDAVCDSALRLSIGSDR
jgi:hypothetical protein